MKLMRRNVIKLKDASLPVPVISGNLSKVGSLQYTGFDKLTLTAFLNCQLNYIALAIKTGIKNTNP